MMKFILLLLSIVTLVACGKSSEKTELIRDFKVETLFTHEGCTVYRFYDDRRVYFTNCQGSTQSSYNCGKGCSGTDNIPTYKGN